MELQTNIINIISDEGIELKKRGKAYFGHCPFHDDQHPSFCVYEDSNRFICFGCGEKGDAIDFIRKLKNFNFKQAIAYLGIDNTDKASWKGIKKSNKQKLISAFQKWTNHYYDELATSYRVFNRLSRNFKTMEDVEQFDLLYHQLPIWEYHMDILLFGDDESKLNLFMEVGQ